MFELKCLECGNSPGDHLRRQRCDPCYRRLLNELKGKGSYSPRTRSGRPLGERVLAKVAAGWGGCWIYTGKVDRYGYGVINDSGTTKRVHRIAYQSSIGPIPDGMQLDHLCHSTSTTCSGGRECIHRRCMNPAHLELVGLVENVRRGLSPSAVNGRKTHCKRGHEFTPENTRISPGRTPQSAPERACKACIRLLRSKRPTATGG